ncbi:MAG: hypothetical protein AAF525_07800 [Pseudomonadota bacterium]
MIVGSLLGLYMVVGVLFALAFVVMGIGRVDTDARRSGIIFRVMMVPGATLLWPILITRWLRTRS